MTRKRYSQSAVGVLSFLVAVFALTVPASAEWKEKVLYSFQGGATDGALPAGGVVFDAAGNLYGATTQGFGFCPPAQCGSVFQLSPPVKQGDPWTETVLHVFTGNINGDGDTPASGLVIDSSGNLYGTTAYGGTGDCVLLGTKVGCGIVYEMTPPQTKGGFWTETVLYSFPSPKQGYLPNGDLVFDSAGNLYGATMFGGGQGTTCNKFYQYCGAVFELSPPKTKGGKWTEKVLHGFRSGTDGANPNGGLVLDSKGTIYGTTFGGGNESGQCGSGGCGTAFELRPPATKGGIWTEKILHRFQPQDGANPAAGVVFGRDGKLYGTASAGATNGNGDVFDLAAPTGGRGPWKETVLYHFGDGNDGTSPRSAVIFDVTGCLYGTALGGKSHLGVVFRLKHPKHGSPWSLTTLYNFTGTPEGSEPKAKLISDGLGNLYGTTQYGGSGTACQGGCGTVFEAKP
jgi:hypothetical protein